ncbi:hypothetical protein K8O68_16930 [Salipaludibacillus sp. CUR1]|uniref:hypothetical protein n=1 Tax=Salipaludibacillus sp. CUR1 TaxID=2820003 RepID=UPI001E567AC7|nr:hypothetical protein [Salipaludibacillus sp. CUR1]MCE7794075.1 hypothetical protein [Salipaludibacillus sp. CUR1]
MVTPGKSVFTAGSALLVLSACNNGNGEATGDRTEQLEAEVEDLEQNLSETESALKETEAQLAEKEEQMEKLEEQVNEQENSTEEDDAENDRGNENDGDSVVTGDDELRDKADDVVIALENEDYQSLANYVHPEEGVRFSPYGHVDPEEHLTFSREEVQEFAEDEEEYEWGIQDGSGEPIILTPSEYYEDYVYIRDFSREAEEILVNEIESRGHIEVNVEEVYPDGEFVSYYVSETDEELNWANMILSFAENNGGWYLTGVTIDKWTI